LAGLGIHLTAVLDQRGPIENRQTPAACWAECLLLTHTRQVPERTVALHYREYRPPGRIAADSFLQKSSMALKSGATPAMESNRRTRDGNRFPAVVVKYFSSLSTQANIAHLITIFGRTVC